MEERDIVLSYNDNRMVSGESGLSHRRSSSTRPSMSAGHDRVSSGSGPSSGIARAGARRLSVLAPPATIFRKQSKSQASPTIAHKREPSDVLRKLLPGRISSDDHDSDTCSLDSFGCVSASEFDRIRDAFGGDADADVLDHVFMQMFQRDMECAAEAALHVQKDLPPLPMSSEDDSSPARCPDPLDGAHDERCLSIPSMSGASTLSSDDADTEHDHVAATIWAYAYDPAQVEDANRAEGDEPDAYVPPSPGSTLTSMPSNASLIDWARTPTPTKSSVHEMPSTPIDQQGDPRAYTHRRTSKDRAELFLSSRLDKHHRIPSLSHVNTNSFENLLEQSWDVKARDAFV